MKKEINQRRRSLLPATIATVFLLGASAFAQSTSQNHRFGFDRYSSHTKQDLLLMDKTIARGTSLDFWRKMSVNGDQDKTEYPKPDFSAMEKWYEIVKWEYKVFDRQLYVVVKAKEESRPYLFEMRYEDADGVIILETTVGSLDLWGARVGEPLKLKIITPSESQMDSVKKVYVFRQKG